ncbi:cysteine rich repeat-containing protein [Bradyrhizobium sp. GCM10027634]|uniref:cysteine rich repeat-containing protein n=1 Tax=unclassified Bradyrhizobium TaxID=2631580 RepID=UPI00188B03E9|nr:MULTISPECIES: cysteine rich repeat-containing protein [unclassified Bradyrhizobium]MDN5000613.1 cysteine rich repeat-containing protein [Bradyrhizobium sp. WYCCWR 12677]QOZ42656.1 hypothetical protein XH89_03605 [Bradyrhizobium sp. CCBAU 53340]
MFNTLKYASARHALLAAALFATATSAFAQAPTEAQKSAIRSACRSDFMAHCASVTPGGVEAYQCLQSHMSSLSAGCQTAVRAVEPAAAPKTEAAPAKSEPAKSEPAKPEPAKTEAAPAAEPAAKPAASAAPKAAAAKPGSAQVAAVKSACRADYPKVCASVPPGGAPALECLEKNKAKLSAACEKAVTAAAGGGGAPATAAPASGAAPAAGAAPAVAPAVIVLRPLRPREELFIVRSACGADIRSLCAGIAPGGGRIVQCIASNAASLSTACKDVLAPFAAR